MEPPLEARREQPFNLRSEARGLARCNMRGVELSEDVQADDLAARGGKHRSESVAHERRLPNTRVTNYQQHSSAIAPDPGRDLVIGEPTLANSPRHIEVLSFPSITRGGAREIEEVRSDQLPERVEASLGVAKRLTGASKSNHAGALFAGENGVRPTSQDGSA